MSEVAEPTLAEKLRLASLTIAEGVRAHQFALDSMKYSAEMAAAGLRMMNEALGDAASAIGVDEGEDEALPRYGEKEPS